MYKVKRCGVLEYDQAEAPEWYSSIYKTYLAICRMNYTHTQIYIYISFIISKDMDDDDDMMYICIEHTKTNPFSFPQTQFSLKLIET